MPQNCEVAARSPPLAAGRTDARNGPAPIGRIDRSNLGSSDFGVVGPKRASIGANTPGSGTKARAGESAESGVKRFDTEAEAAANLDHSGIVPIYEVGQHDGQCSISMGFVEGQSLAHRRAEGPLPPREAAELLVKVVEAIE